MQARPRCLTLRRMPKSTDTTARRAARTRNTIRWASRSPSRRTGRTTATPRCTGHEPPAGQASPLDSLPNPADGRTSRLVTLCRIAAHDNVRRHADPFSAAPCERRRGIPERPRQGRPATFRCTRLIRDCAGLYGKIGWYRKGPGSMPFMLQASISNYVADFELA